MSDLHACIDQAPGARALLSLAEDVLERWLAAQGRTAAPGEREGFRLLALHHQGAQGVPSFNACRETCREIAYHYNLLASDPGPAEGARHLEMMRLLVRHLALFTLGKIESERLGDFCCASKPLRA